MSEILPEELIKETLQEDKGVLLRPNPDLVKLIATLSESTLEENTENNLSDVVYHTTKIALRHPSIRSTVTSMIPAIFVYYVETRKVMAMIHVDGSDHQGKILNEAALDIFTIYTDFPHDHTSRHLVEFAARALHDVIVSKISQNEDLKFQDVMGRLSTLALLTETVKEYTAKSKRIKNIPYIKWLKDFLKTCLESDDLSFMEEDKVLLKVTPQITNRCKVIIL